MYKGVLLSNWGNSTEVLKVVYYDFVDMWSKFKN